MRLVEGTAPARRIRPGLLGVWLGLLTGTGVPLDAVAAEPAFARVVPDDAVLYVEVGDMSLLAEAAGSGALGEYFANEAFQELLAPAMEAYARSEAAVFTRERILEHFGGEMAAALRLSTEWSVDSAADLEGVLLLEHTARAEELEPLLRDIYENLDRAGETPYRFEEEDLGGEWRLYTIAPEPPGDAGGAAENGRGVQTEEEAGDAGAFLIGYNGSTVVMSDTRARVQLYLYRLADPGVVSPVGRTGAYYDARDLVERPGMVALLNLEPLWEALLPEVEEASRQAPPNPLGITPKALWDALRPDNLRHISLALDYEEGKGEAASVLVYERMAGIVELLVLEDEPARYPGFVPKEVSSAAAMRYDFAAAWRTVETLIARSSPQAESMLNAQLQALRSSTGVDVRNVFLVGLGDSVAMLTPRAEPGELSDNQVIIFSVEDRQSIELTIQAIKDTFFPRGVFLEESEYLGTSLNIVRPPRAPGEAAPQPDPDATLSWAFLPGYLVVSPASVSHLREVVSLHNAPERDGLWQQAFVQRAIEERLPAEPSRVDFDDIGALTEMLAGLASMPGINTRTGAGKFFDFEALGRLPPFPYFLLSGYYVADGRMTTRSFLVEKPKE